MRGGGARASSRDSEAPRPQAGASRARSGERKASKRNIVLIVPLDPACMAGLVGHLPVIQWLDPSLLFEAVEGHLYLHNTLLQPPKDQETILLRIRSGLIHISDLLNRTV